MKKILLCAIAAVAVSAAFGQGAFTISRPANNSVVRETVKVRIPRNSIADGSYVGIWVNGKFVEAVAPTDRGDVQNGMFVYELDTKAREIADGTLRIEAILYAAFDTGTRALKRSSVSVKLDNHTSLKPPTGGFALRYGFRPGREYIYNIDMRRSATVLSEAQAQLGGRAAELGKDSESLRYLVAVDQTYKNGAEALVRMQPLPDNGKDYAIITLPGDSEPKRYDKSTMHPIYYRLANTGREVFGRGPFYFGLDGQTGSQAQFDLFATIPLPILPSKGVRVGESWNGAFVTYAIEDISKLYESQRLTAPSPCRGTLEALEWQNGQRTARIRNKLAVSGGESDAAGQNEQEEVIWFSLDKGMPIRIERNYTRTMRIRVGGGSTAAGGGNAPSGGFGRRPGGGPGPGAGPGAPEDGMMMRQGRQGPRPGGSRQGPGPSGGGATGGGAAGGGAAGGGGGGVRIIRERAQIVMTLQATL